VATRTGKAIVDRLRLDAGPSRLTMHRHKGEHHRIGRAGALRAAVLGANDGIVSIASLVIGVAAAGSSRSAVVTAGVAGLVAGAMSMAAGEFVSVSSQRDVEIADLEMERQALEEEPAAELRELAAIYEERGVEPGLARLVAEQLMAHDDLAAHARDELGITESLRAQPLVAASSSAVAFVAGAILPLLAISFSGRGIRVGVTAAVALVTLVSLGALGARAGGASVARGAGRVLFWGGLAMAATWAIGRLVGATV
jgi:VIT1/CCC1 family predicted Fe2+/Mn2+ transporter